MTGGAYLVNLHPVAEALAEPLLSNLQHRLGRDLVVHPQNGSGLVPFLLPVLLCLLFFQNSGQLAEKIVAFQVAVRIVV